MGRAARGLVASAGYLGAAAVGCLLIAATRVPKWAHAILLGLGAFMLFTLALWIRNVFGASLGGPLKKNRLFFFLNFEDTITRREEPQLRIVPSLTLRQGSLRYLNASGAVRTA